MIPSDASPARGRPPAGRSPRAVRFRVRRGHHHASLAGGYPFSEEVVMPWTTLLPVVLLAVVPRLAGRAGARRPARAHLLHRRPRSRHRASWAWPCSRTTSRSARSCPGPRPASGAVATQSLVLVDYGPNGLDLMRAGMTAQQALDSLLRADAHNEGRQVAMVDAKGDVAAYTGRACIPDAGHHARRPVLRAGEPHGERPRLARHGEGLREQRRATWPSGCSPHSTPRSRRAATSAAGSRRRSWW